jgi:hypothetical protein
MQGRQIGLALMGLGFVGVVTFAVLADDRKENGNQEGQKIALDQVPAPAREALSKLAGGAQITKVEKEDENGVEVYEATWTVDGKKHEGKVKADGTPFNEEDEEADEKVTLDQVPAKVREALTKLAGGAKITSIEKGNMDGAIGYEAEWMVNGRKVEAAVTTDGTLLGTEEVLDAKDVPEAVRQAAAKMFPGAQKLTFEKETKITYEVVAEIDGKKHEADISPGGKAQKEEQEEGDQDEDDDENSAKH